MKKWLQKVSRSVRKLGDKRRVSSGKWQSWRLSFGKSKDTDEANGDGVAGPSVQRKSKGLSPSSFDGMPRDSVARGSSTVTPISSIACPSTPPIPPPVIVRDFAITPLAAAKDTFIHPRTPPPQPPSPPSTPSHDRSQTSLSPRPLSIAGSESENDGFKPPRTSVPSTSAPTQDERDRRDAAAEYLRKRSQAAMEFRGEEGGMLSPMGGSSPVHSDNDDVGEEDDMGSR